VFSEKAAQLGITVEWIDEAYSTRTCSVSGHVQPSSPRGRRFRCSGCGARVHRDVNGSANICSKAVFGRYSQIQAAGVMGNMRNESDFNVETNWPDTNGFHAYGLISWNARFYPRAPALVTGHQRADLARQVQYLLHHTRRIRKGLRGSTVARVAAYPPGRDRMGHPDPYSSEARG